MTGPYGKIAASIVAIAVLAAAGGALWLHFGRKPAPAPVDRSAPPITSSVEVRAVPEAKRAG